ncbi:PEP-CTERM sorting domain-containing protein [Marinobacter caseinilyticus]|uniref:PEP-CTERM sorting domain-containing protein n=1 Tax=Marinobacter caseinilyticus TaxID=2692195 RepID=UPI001A94FA62|nr:PEP-CTERM sorting domain-containing protein [Marinobacter caseinilyticus]
MKRIGLVLVGLMLTFSSATAGVIVDTVYQYEKVNWGSQYSYTHNLIDEGFTPGTAISGDLKVSIYDDYDPWYDFLPEVILFVIEEFDFDSGGISLSSFYGALEVTALAAINADGMLDVTVKSILGDFYLGKSVLTVVTEEVPAPGTLALLGLGILGLAFQRRRKS